MTDASRGGDNATIREVYVLVDQTRQQMLSEVRALSSRVESGFIDLAIRVEGIDTRLAAHDKLPGHPILEARVERISMQIARWSGAVALLVVLVGLLIKLV